MGSASRFARCEEFIKEFDDDYKNKFFRDGPNVIDQGLRIDQDRKIVIYEIVIRFENTIEADFLTLKDVFDPDSLCNLIEKSIGFDLELEEEVVLNRLIKAGLIYKDE